MNYYSHNASDFSGASKVSQLPMVYALATSDLEYVKIGKTRAVKQRFINVQSGCPFELHLWLSIRTPRPDDVERDLHRHLSHCRTRGEWFTPSPDDLDALIDYFRRTNDSVREASRALL